MILFHEYSKVSIGRGLVKRYLSCSVVMVALHHWTRLTKSGKNSSPVPPPPPQRGGGEDTPFENCAKKRRVGTTDATLYATFCMVVTSVTAPLEIGGSTDKYGKWKLVPLTMKIEGSERGKEKGTAPAANTTAPAQLACRASGACFDCGY